MYIYICVCTYVCVYIHICVVMANPLRFPLQLHCRAKVLLNHEHHEWKIDVFAPAGPDDGEEGGPLYEKHGVLLAQSSLSTLLPTDTPASCGLLSWSDYTVLSSRVVLEGKRIAPAAGVCATAGMECGSVGEA
jgi:hypothetical protein